MRGGSDQDGNYGGSDTDGFKPGPGKGDEDDGNEEKGP